MRNNKKKGFTLVELLVVIAILAILATVSTVGYTAFVERARESVASTELAQITKVISTDLMDDGEIVINVADGANAGKYVITNNGTTLTYTKNGAAPAADGLEIGEVLNLHEDIAALGGELELTGYDLTFTKTYNGIEVEVTDNIG